MSAKTKCPLPSDHLNHTKQFESLLCRCSNSVPFVAYSKTIILVKGFFSSQNPIRFTKFLWFILDNLSIWKWNKEKLNSLLTTDSKLEQWGFRDSLVEWLIPFPVTRSLGTNFHFPTLYTLKKIYVLQKRKSKQVLSDRKFSCLFPELGFWTLWPVFDWFYCCRCHCYFNSSWQSSFVHCAVW